MPQKETRLSPKQQETALSLIAKIKDDVYLAIIGSVEKLEHEGLLSGNGSHVVQKVQTLTESILRSAMRIERAPGIRVFLAHGEIGVTFVSAENAPRTVVGGNNPDTLTRRSVDC